tara:strand:+ start:748 stop:1845 length:1098 start_codon:yes stop_codon:yes gene_type:complete
MSNARKLADNLPSVGQLGNRNLIINGAMQVAQRGAGPFTNASGGYQTVDRFQLGGTMGGNFTLEQSSDAPSGSGFDKSFKALAPTGFSSPTSSASTKVVTSIEGQNLQHLLYGTSDAVYLTVSFWVKATVTGTYILEIEQADASRHLSTAYTISSSNTWEKKTITVVGDTSGTINNDNGSGLSLKWFIAAGSIFTSGTLATTWATTTTANRAVGQVNGVASNNDAFYITGVQLEVGSQSTPFEHEPVGVTLKKCQRYYWNTNQFNNRYVTAIKHGGNWYCSFSAPTTMRADPTPIGTGGSTNSYKIWDGDGSSTQSGGPSVSAGASGTILVVKTASIGSNGEAGLMTFGDGTNADRAFVALDAEL